MIELGFGTRPFSGRWIGDGEYGTANRALNWTIFNLRDWLFAAEAGATSHGENGASIMRNFMPATLYWRRLFDITYTHCANQVENPIFVFQHVYTRSNVLRIFTSVFVQRHGSVSDQRPPSKGGSSSSLIPHLAVPTLTRQLFDPVDIGLCTTSSSP